MRKHIFHRGIHHTLNTLCEQLLLYLSNHGPRRCHRCNHRPHIELDFNHIRPEHHAKLLRPDLDLTTTKRED